MALAAATEENRVGLQVEEDPTNPLQSGERQHHVLTGRVHVPAVTLHGTDP